MTDYTIPMERIAIAVEEAVGVLERIAAALEDDDEEENEGSDRAFEGMIDYRQETRAQIPETCPECGDVIERSIETGEVDLNGPADMEWAATVGITKPGKYRTIWWAWRCGQNPAHAYGPVLAGTGWRIGT